MVTRKNKNPLLFTFTIYLWLVFFVLFRNPKALLNRICALLILTFALWAIGHSFMLGSSTYEEARLADNISKEIKA
ncbi:MAG: hypothetical protein P8Y70_17960 [Candidatus Lokiarchaeota archaeon]